MRLSDIWSALADPWNSPHTPRPHGLSTDYTDVRQGSILYAFDSMGHFSDVVDVWNSVENCGAAIHD
jgi:hypothetical protein